MTVCTMSINIFLLTWTCNLLMGKSQYQNELELDVELNIGFGQKLINCIWK